MKISILLFFLICFIQCKNEESIKVIEGTYSGNIFYYDQGIEQKISPAVVQLSESGNLNVHLNLSVLDEFDASDTLFTISTSGLKSSSHNFDISTFLFDGMEHVGDGISKNDFLTMEVDNTETGNQFFLFSGDKIN